MVCEGPTNQRTNDLRFDVSLISGVKVLATAYATNCEHAAKQSHKQSSVFESSDLCDEREYGDIDTSASDTSNSTAKNKYVDGRGRRNAAE